MANYSFVTGLFFGLGIIALPEEYKNPNYALPYFIIDEQEVREYKYAPIPVNLFRIYTTEIEGNKAFTLTDSEEVVIPVDGDNIAYIDETIWGIYKDTSCDCDQIVLGLATLDEHLHSKLTSIDEKLIATQIYDLKAPIEDLPDIGIPIDTVELASVIQFLISYLNKLNV